jgi:hypothetical protein
MNDMKSNITRRSLVQLTGLATASTLVACGSQPGADKQQGQNEEDANSSESNEHMPDATACVVYFSRADENYTEDGTEKLKVGHTKVMAGYISKALKCVSYELVPVDAYPASYAECCSVASKELADDARPAISTILPKFSTFKTIFIGCPIWWENEPMIIRTFLDKADLSGKKIVPFTTCSSSGLVNVPDNLQARMKDATILEGHSVVGTEVDKAEQEVIDWAKGLDIA